MNHLQHFLEHPPTRLSKPVNIQYEAHAPETLLWFFSESRCNSSPWFKTGSPKPMTPIGLSWFSCIFTVPLNQIWQKKISKHFPRLLASLWKCCSQKGCCSEAVALGRLLCLRETAHGHRTKLLKKKTRKLKLRRKTRMLRCTSLTYSAGTNKKLSRIDMGWVAYPLLFQV